MFLSLPLVLCYFFFFFNDPATTEIYTLSLHDALPICLNTFPDEMILYIDMLCPSVIFRILRQCNSSRSEEHTSELQSRPHLVCRLLLEKKKQHRVQDRLRGGEQDRS